MEILIYAVIFIIGTVFGSFFTLAVYRIPLKENITYKRSFCPNCNHRLEFLDLIPVLSYIFLGGKCRYCKKKIRPRYLILELLSGLAFLLYALELRLNIFNFQLTKLVFLVYGLLFISTLFIIAGIDKEKHSISKPVLVFGLILNAMYIIYLYVLNINIYKYVIYFIIMLVLLIIQSIYNKNNKTESYPIAILTLCMYLVCAINELAVIISIILMLLIIAIKQMIFKGNEKNNICIGYYMCLIFLIILLIKNIII